MKKTAKSEDKVLLAKINELEAKGTEMEENWKRSLADYANLEKRVESQKQLIASLASAAIMAKMVDVLDELYLAQKHLNDKGLQMAIDHFVGVLKGEGLEEISCLGQQFNPETMDCVDVADGDQDQVIDIRRRGFLLNGQCLRPAQVVVGRAPQASPLSKN